MRARSAALHYAVVALEALLLLFIARQLVVLVHELSHGLAAVALGGQFQFFQIVFLDGRSIFVFPPDAPPWKEGAALLAGHGVSLALALACLAVARTSRQGSGRALFAAFTGAVAAASVLMGSNIVRPWVIQAEIGSGLSLLGLPRSARMAVDLAGLISAVVLTVVFLRRILDAVVVSGGPRTYWSRFAAGVSGLLVPGLALAAVERALTQASGCEVCTVSAASPLITPYAAIRLACWTAVAFLLPLLIRRDRAAAGTRHGWRRSVSAYAAMALALAATQIFVFGLDKRDPRGVFLTSQPAEVTVAACNVRVHVTGQDRAHVQFLMRPFVSQHRFLWTRVRQREPVAWGPYDAFVQQSAPLGATGCTVIRRYVDPEAAFYVAGQWDPGARIVEADCELGPSDRDPRGRTLVVSDAWRKQQLGHLDMVQVDVAGELILAGVRVEPASARTPAIAADAMVRWENPDYRGSFETAYLTLARRH